ncbi:MAG: diguanylate cyclase [Proteobacteria bacterium]|nr:diguanylate cyclase [Pseudomonadota bacterium]
MSKVMSKGYLYAYISVCLSAMYNIIAKVSLTYNISPSVFVGIGTMAASVALFQIAGAGKLSFASFKSPRTSLYAICSLLEHLFTIHMFIYVAGAEGSLMQRINMFMALVIALIFFDRKPKMKDWFSSILVLIGVSILIYNLESNTRIIAVFWMLMATLFNTTKTFIAERHPESNKAKTFRDQARVTAFVRFATSFLFLFFLFTIAVVKQYSGVETPILNSAPDLKDFVHPATFIWAILFGVLNNAPTAYFYFFATKTVKTEKFVAIAAFVPVITLIGEYILSLFDVLEHKPFGIHGYFAMAIILLGSIIMAQKPKTKKKAQKLAPKTKEDLLVLRQTIKTAFICFDDDIKKVAKTLNVAQKTINNIMTKDEPVPENIRNKIVLNHAKKIASLDYMTGTLNKTSFDLVLADLKDKDKALVVFIDLDKFKPINDNYGHDAGDAVLKGVAERLMDEFSTPHVVARLGGDEYCLIIYGIDQKHEEKYIAKIKKLVCEPFIVDGFEDEIAVGCSVGAAHYPEEGDCGLALKKVADERMYKDKKANGNQR